MTNSIKIIIATIFLVTLIGCVSTNESSRASRPLVPVVVAPDDLLARVSKSLVVVRYTYEAELGRRDIEGTGIVVRDDGLVAFPMSLIPSQMPESQAVDFKIIIPADIDGPDQIELPAIYQGRDERADLAYVKVTGERKWAALKASEQKPKVGEVVYSVGLLTKNSGYTPYIRRAEISSILRGPVPLILTSGGLCIVGSPVFDQSGVMIGIVNQMDAQTPLLNGDDSSQSASLLIPPNFFTPMSYYALSINNPPSPEAPIKLTWLGLWEMNGLNRELSEYYGLGSRAGIQVGDVVPNSNAEAGGLKAGDVIVGFNGNDLERGDRPEELPMIFRRDIQRIPVGQTVMLSVIRQPRGEPIELKVKLDERPPISSDAFRFWAEDLGFTVRDLVFTDRYSRKLDDDFKGMMVTFIRPQSAAQAGSLQRGDVITKFGQDDIESVEKFKTQYQTFRKEKPTEAIVFEVLRGTDTQIIRIEPPR